MTVEKNGYTKKNTLILGRCVHSKLAELTAGRCDVAAFAAPDRSCVFMCAENFLKIEQLFFIWCAKLRLWVLIEGDEVNFAADAA